MAAMKHLKRRGGLLSAMTGALAGLGQDRSPLGSYWAEDVFCGA